MTFNLFRNIEAKCLNSSLNSQNRVLNDEYTELHKVSKVKQENQELMKTINLLSEEVLVVIIVVGSFKR